MNHTQHCALGFSQVHYSWHVELKVDRDQLGADWWTVVSQLQLAINEAATSCAAQVAGHTWNTSYWTLQLAGGAVYVHIPLRQAGHGGLLVGETEVTS